MSTSVDDPGGADEAARLQQALALLRQHQAQLGDDVVARAAQGLQQRLDALAGAASVPRLRQVSVLFVDIVDSTGLLQALGPEDGHAVIDGGLRRFAEAVRRHGGQVLRFMGDGLKAAFGLPEPADDDALRAVRAGQAVLAEALAHGQAMSARLGPLRFAVRAGLHTGPVALGVGAEDAQTLVGATVHLAAGLERHAEPGTLRVSHDTWRLTRGAFDFEVLAPLRLKGMADPLRTYRLMGERAPGQRASGRGIDGLDTALIGRAVPLAALDATVRSLAPGGSGRLVTVLGDAGVGKSRLRQALLQSLADPMTASDVQVLAGAGLARNRAHAVGPAARPAVAPRRPRRQRAAGRGARAPARRAAAAAGRSCGRSAGCAGHRPLPGPGACHRTARCHSGAGHGRGRRPAAAAAGGAGRQPGGVARAAAAGAAAAAARRPALGRRREPGAGASLVARAGRPAAGHRRAGPAGAAPTAARLARGRQRRAADRARPARCRRCRCAGRGAAGPPAAGAAAPAPGAVAAQRRQPVLHRRTGLHADRQRRARHPRRRLALAR
jgi:class 3 adenylate cyclase